VQAPNFVISLYQTIPNSAILSSQDQTSLPPSSPFMVNDSTVETRDGETINQVLSEENHARLREIFSWLQKDARDQVRDVDHFEEMLESIDQELPEDIKASLEPISDLDIH
jgi:hypothetical protein